MIKRTITAVVALTVFIALAILSPEYSIPIFCILAAFLGANEIIAAFQKIEIVPIKNIVFLACIYTLIIPVLYLILGKEKSMSLLSGDYMMLFIFLIIILLIINMILKSKYTLKDMTTSIFITLYIPLLISFVSLTNYLENGKYYVWIIFISVWAVDIFAYFVGSIIGKNHFIERISPKKTLEGFFGGIFGSVFGLFIYWLFIRELGIISLLDMIIIGLIIGVIAQFGDWIASIIKRQTGIKDFGTIFPGHGGIIDRIDSILLSAPIVYFYIKLIVI